MKTQQEICKQLEEIYQHRLLLRIQRKTKKTCRNCKFGVQKVYNLGQFGEISKWQCSMAGNKIHDCNKFQCLHNEQQIQKQMIKDLSDPSICGAKEPKIAMLMWILHDQNKKREQKKTSEKSKNFFEKIKELWK